MAINKKKLSVKDIVANIDRNHKWSGNILQKMAEEIVRYAIPIEEVIKNDVTIKLLKEYDREIKNKEIAITQINAKPRMAKSTLGIFLGMFKFELLKKYKMKKETDQFGMKNIARDQNEKTKKMRNPELMFDVIVTDESNASEDTGENSTVEKAQRDVHSDIQAGRYVHGVWICPEGTMDKNCDIKLEIRNKEKGLIHTRVYYFCKSSYYYGWVLIGIANFDVSKLIKIWQGAENRFFNYLKTGNKEDKKYIDIIAKRDFYTYYMCKKYEKMELYNKEGIQHARDLDYAEVIQEVVIKLKPLAKSKLLSFQLVKKNIKVRLERAFQKRGLPLSMLGNMSAIDRIEGYLQNYRNQTEISDEIMKTAIKYKKDKITFEKYEKQKKELQELLTEIEELIQEDETYIAKLIKLNEKYNEHL